MHALSPTALNLFKAIATHLVVVGEVELVHGVKHHEALAELRSAKLVKVHAAHGIQWFASLSLKGTTFADSLGISPLSVITDNMVNLLDARFTPLS